MVLQGIGMRRGDLLPALLLLNWPSLGTWPRDLRVAIGVHHAHPGTLVSQGGDVDRTEEKL